MSSQVEKAYLQWKRNPDARHRKDVQLALEKAGVTIDPPRAVLATARKVIGVAAWKSCG